MCFSLLFSCYLEPDITHNDCRTPDTKNSLLLKMHFFTRISFWSQSYHYNSLLHFSSLFLEEMNTIFTWDTGISFPWLPFLYPKTVPCWVYSVFLSEALWCTRSIFTCTCTSSVEFWTEFFGYAPDLFIYLFFKLLLRTKTQDSSGSPQCRFTAMDFGWVLWASSGGSQSSIQEPCRRPLLSWGCHSSRSDTLSGCFPFTTKNS